MCQFYSKTPLEIEQLTIRQLVLLSSSAKDKVTKMSPDDTVAQEPSKPSDVPDGMSLATFAKEHPAKFRKMMDRRRRSEAREERRRKRLEKRGKAE